MHDVYLHAAVRTPQAPFSGALRDTGAVSLATEVARSALQRSGVDPERVGEVLLGQVFPHGCGPNPARQAALGAGIPATVPAASIHQLCGSGMRAVMLGAQSIRAGEAESVLALGVESMSRVPFLLPEARWGSRMGAARALDPLFSDGLECPLTGQATGCLVEQVAERLGISREAQDGFADESHRKAVAAWESGAFQREVLPLQIRRGRRSAELHRDEGPRPDSNLAALAQLKPVFSPEGTITAGNACPLSDGAAALLLSRHPAPIRVAAAAHIGIAPEDFPLGPVPAMQRVLAQAGLRLSDIDRFELNEAFAAQTLAVLKTMPDLDPARVNVRGGAIALGHPVGASGARILVTLAHILQDEGLRYGLAALCVGGGMGIALLLEHQP